MIDLLERLITDAKVKANRSDAKRATAIRPLAQPGTYGAALREQLSAEAEAGETSAQYEARYKPSLPRALVLLTTETFCTNCGARYRAPGHSIIAEYAFNQASVCRTMDDVCRHDRRAAGDRGASLPREHRTLTVHAPACEACF
jgi:hypothetical protein